MTVAATTSDLPVSRPAEAVAYNYAVVRRFTVATVIWALVGMGAGVILAAQLSFPLFNLEPYLTFGRLRPLHTSIIVFGFGGNALIATSLYVVQRTCRARLWGGPVLAEFTFWGFQAFLLMAGVGYLMGATQVKEFAEPEWWADLWLLVVWVAYLALYLGTILKRKEPHIYVANWFYLAFIITVAVLHVVNNIAVPECLTCTGSYSLYAGVQDAMIQWWYGHNIVGFLLTAGFIGMMYYFLPKQAERPVWSYRMSVLHFWALIFIYIWAGPHHLHYTALPEWTQTLGMVFSIMLWMPSWGGMINGIMTVSGAWHKLRTDPILRFLLVAVAFYGMSTFEGPLLALKPVNALSHFTDWTIGHVHSGALGWVGFMAFGSLYHMVPRLVGKPLHSLKLVEWHFWLASIGLILYITAMWVSGVSQGLMWKAYDEYGFLKYTFGESVAAMHPYYVVRLAGGLFYLAGGALFAWNLAMTAWGRPSKSGAASNSSLRTNEEGRA